jgi:acyl-coenzyme A thioesterase PaaI-like protein
MPPTTAPDPDPWANRDIDLRRGGDTYGAFLAAFRDLQDAVSRSDPPVEIWEQMLGSVREMTSAFDSWGAPEREQPAGTRRDLPGRGHPFLVPFSAVHSDENLVQGRVTFRRFHLGGNGAAHGGALPLLFDEVLGHLCNAGGRPVARTARLTINYRHITPIEVELQVEARFDRQEGRKRWLSASLTNGETVVADAEGLFIQLRPGQP